MNPLGAADPTSIASYRLLAVLGSGGMGRVYLAQSATGRRLAIKVIRADLADNPVFRRRFAHEVAAVRAVNPLFTAAIVDADTDAPAPWLATTYIDGPSLEQWVTNHGPLVPSAVLTLAAGLAEALASIHRAGLVHRDLKPSNVLLDDAGPHIIDFGIALSPDSTRITTSLVGTPSYMAPERLRGAEAAPAADVFSLGATLAFAATGRRLADGDSMYEQLLKMTSGRFDLSPVPVPVRRLVARCVSRRPRDRPSADELTELLASASEIALPEPGWYRGPAGATETPTVEPVTMRLSRRRVIAAGGLLGVLAAGGGAVALAGAASGPSSVFGAVLWQVGSGTVPREPQDPWTATARIAVDPAGRVIASNPPTVFAMNGGGRRQWSRALSVGPLDVRLWGDAVLVNDARQVWLLDRATGAQRFTADLAGAEEARLRTAPGQVRIRQVEILSDRAFLDLNGTTVAIDRGGNAIWRAPAATPGGQPSASARTPVSAALTAGPARLITLDRSGSLARSSLYDPRTGTVSWSTGYDLPPMTDEPLGPPPPDGGPPPGFPPGSPPGSPPPGAPPFPPPDPSWQWSEAKLGTDLVALRNARSIQVRRAADGSLAWQDTAATPVAAIEIVGDVLLVAAERLTAYDLSTGARSWQEPLRGARLAASPDGRTAVAVTEQELAVVDRTGIVRHADLSRALRGGVPDRLTVAAQTAYLALWPHDSGGAPLEVDALAVDLRGTLG